MTQTLISSPHELLAELYAASDAVLNYAAIHIKMDERYSGGFNTLGDVLNKVDEFLYKTTKEKDAK